ncbi:unnamed protein product [Adineta ricciae]|uniref:Uncharacterized protein n=1 Tax=Adineta ricciae TaxID=249248 RepID=A0A815WT91_ADIRI|nr:unnamed protein product [Adineta ricciae]
MRSPLSMNEKYDLLITDVAHNEFESIPDALNKTTLAIQRTNRDFHGAMKFYQNMTDSTWRYFVSSYEILTYDIEIHWNWYLPSVIVDNDDMTSPTIDDNGTAYMSSIPLVFVIDKSEYRSNNEKH